MGTRSDSVANALWYLFTRRHLLEGHYSRLRKRYRNWDQSFTASPARFLYPETEEEICAAVRNSERIAAVGAGHSFNGLHLDRHTLISLDRYVGMIRHDPKRLTAVFRGGARLRDTADKLKSLGLALPVLPDHNAQSLGGILATDVHASGKAGAPAFVSEAVNYLRVVDGHGVAHDTYPGEPLFRATLGGMGCTGIVVEVGFQCVAPFNVKTSAVRCTFEEMIANLDTWRTENELVAAGYFPHIDACVVEFKNRVQDPLTPFGPFRETLRHVLQAIVQTLFLPAARSPKSLQRRVGRWVLDTTTKHVREHKELVLDNFEGFNRNVYQVHSEAEFTVPLDKAREALTRGRELMRAHPESAHYLLGIRMSHANPETMVGAGAGGQDAQIAWIAPHLDGHVRDEHDDARWAALCRELHGRPHYGKNLLSLDGPYLAQEHGQHWNDFVQLLQHYDPHRKFSNKLSTDVVLPLQQLSTPIPLDSSCTGEDGLSLLPEATYPIPHHEFETRGCVRDPNPNTGRNDGE